MRTALATTVLDAAFLGAAFLGAAFLGAAFLGAALLGAAFLDSACLDSAWTRGLVLRRAAATSELCTLLAAASMNPGGIRDDLNAGEVLWGELFAIQPFSNDVVAMDVTGAQIKTLLEQQWIHQNPAKILKISGLKFT